MRQYPGTFSIYKKLGAAQFTLINPKESDVGRIDKNGAILLEIASGSGDRRYDWASKISFALGVSDICQIFENPDIPPRLIHSPPGSTLIKNLELTPGEGKYPGTYMLRVQEKNKETDQTRSASVPISSGEYTVLLRLMLTATPLIIGWD